MVCLDKHQYSQYTIGAMKMSGNILVNTLLRSRKNIILAPHVDDEAIGCWQLLKNNAISHVIYYFETDLLRKAEALKAAEKYKFEPIFFNIRYDMSGRPITPTTITDDTTIFVPSVTDLHPDHKAMNKFGREVALAHNCNIIFYTIDMTSGWQQPLTASSRLEKRADLLELYPSQAALFENEKYWLFEGYIDTETQIKKSFWDGEITMTGFDPPEELYPSLITVDSEKLFDTLITKYYDGHRVKQITYKTNFGEKIYG